MPLAAFPKSSSTARPAISFPFEAGGDAFGSPRDTDRFAQELAARINELVGDPVKARNFGAAGRQRALERFSWTTIANDTVRLYQELLR